MSWWYLLGLVAANLTLLLPIASPVRVLGALLLIGLLPGLSWANHFFTTSPSWLRWTLAAALSYTLTALVTLFLHYLPGPIQMGPLLVALNLIALLPGFRRNGFARLNLPSTPHLTQFLIRQPSTLLNFQFVTQLTSHWSFLLIFLVALLLRTVNLHYSEFQGDEALAMIAAAEALEGHEDALFLRSKGPGEVLLPMAMWRLTGVTNELIARLPFTAAALLAIVTIYLIGEKLGGRRTGWLAAGFFAGNGFMVAFGRIVQYQALVIWFSAMAFLSIIEWYTSRQQRWAILSGLCLGVGLLAHYDTILVLPAIGWLFTSLLIISKPKFRSPASLEKTDFRVIHILKPALFLVITFLLTTLSFYLPYALDPQANRTSDYLGQRIGQELRNNLPDFFHFNTFYSSVYYIILTSLLVLGLLIWSLQRMAWSRWWGPALAAITIPITIFEPRLLTGDTLNLAILPFALIFFGAFFTFWPSQEQVELRVYKQAVIAWLALPFLGYNFVVALGLTHIYTIVPAWSLLAALGWSYFFDRPLQQGVSWVSNGLLGGLLLLSTIFLANAFLRHEVEYWQDYPAGNLSLYWDPYPEPPKTGFFGFAHRSGWKAVGQKIASGELSGDYGSNEELDVTTWYTRGAPRACDPQPEFYFLADDLIDPVEAPAEIITASYVQIGQVTLPNQKQMQIMQQKPSDLTLGQLNEAALARDFDHTATPAAFARSARGSVPVAVNFSNLVQLIGYDLDQRRAEPSGRVPVTLYWQVLAPLPASYQVFTHLESDSGPVAQADGVPVCWTYPTDLWRPGQIIADQHAILIPPEVRPGNYPLQVGFYLADTFTRLDVLDEAGNPAGTSVTLTGVEIKN